METTLRPIQSTDLDTLFAIYASTRVEELAQTNWDDRQKEAFLRMQFEAQHAFYQEQYVDAAFSIIEQHDEPIGRLYVRRLPTETRIVDIALLPRWRNRGIATAYLKALIAESEAAGVVLSIHVEQFNPALRLYQRLGFELIELHGIYWLMHRQPAREASDD